MSKIEPTPNSKQKFEFEFAKEIGQKTDGLNTVSYQYAKKQLVGFVDTFGIKEEKVFIEGDILTFTRLLSDLLEDYSKFLEKEWTNS